MKICRTGPVSTMRPGVHHGHLVAHLGHDAEVVGDEDQGEAVALLQVLQQTQVLGLDGEVEAGGRLVGDEQRAARRRCAMAPTMRWRMPPDIWCGYSRDAGLRRRDAHRREQLAARALQRAPPRASARARGAARATWSPMVKTGLSEAMGSCRIMAMRLPRICRISASDFVSRSRRRSSICRPRCGPPAGRSRRMRQASRALARARLADDARASRPRRA